MQQFLSSVKFETSPEALEALGDARDAMTGIYNAIYKQGDMTRFHDYIDVNRVIRMITWMSEGYIKDCFRNPEPNLDEMHTEFDKYRRGTTGRGSGRRADARTRA